jgi:peptide/nickel transport system permease protein
MTPPHRRLGPALVLVSLIAAAAVLADFLSPIPPETQDLNRFFAPPTRIHVVDPHGRFHWPPFTCAYELTDPLDVRYVESTEPTYPLEFFGEGYPYYFLGLFRTKRHLAVTGEPNALHLFGTDELGRDVLARVLAAARTSLIVVVTGLLIYALTGIVVGTAAGFAGGYIDSALMRTSEFVMAIPALYLVLALRALLPLKMPYWQTVALVAGTIAAVTWPPMARGVRGLVLQLRGAGYVEAARSLGSPPLRTFCKHMMPAITPFVLSQMALAAPAFLLGEAVLSFLDIGFREAGESWGSMLRNLRDLRLMTDFWWNLAPLALIFITLLCLTLIADRLRFRDPAGRLFRM